MQITKENYELFIIDYLDGKLDSKGKQALIAFVEANPKIKEEFDLLMDTAGLESDMETSVPDFGYLKKESILGDQYLADEMMIAELEGDLSPTQSQEFKQVIASDLTKQKDYQIYRSSIAKPDLSIQFPHKQKLKKAGTVIYLNTIYKIASVAAILLFVAFVGWYNLENSNTIQTANKAGNLQMQIASRIALNPNNSQRNMNPKEIQFKEEKLVVKSFELNQIAGVVINQQELGLLKSKSASINPVKIIFGGEPQLVIPVFQSNTALADLGTPIDEFKTPGKWLIEKAKMMKPVQPILKTDSLIRNNEVGNVAINLLNQTPGVVATSKTDEEGNQRGFAIMSRYFSIERSY